MRLSQTIAIEGDVRDQAQTARTRAAQRLAHQQLLNGLSRTYQPYDDQGEKLPPETSLVQARAGQIVDEVRAELARLFDVTATKDWGNRDAKADVRVDGKTLLTDAPAVYLLWLEKQLAALESFANSLPILDPTEHWDFDPAAGVWKTKPVETARTQKRPEVLVKYHATKEHPAQTEVWYQDKPVGNWTIVKASGALPEPEVRQILDRIRKLRLAVKAAREEANTVSVIEQKVGEVILDYVFVG